MTESRQIGGPMIGEGPRANHFFVNNVRFVCMAAVVFLHTIPAWGYSDHVLQAFLQMAKFGTIGFFLTSGFLMGERLQVSAPVPYFLRRMRKIFLPWMFWFVVCLLLVDSASFAHKPAMNAHTIVTTLESKAEIVMFRSAFWFVPNLLLAMGLLLALRRWLDRMWLGAVLLGINLFYVVNIYMHWVSESHTRAPLAFVFYLWLGAWSARHSKQLMERISRTRVSALIAMVVLSALLGYAESQYLLRHGALDPFNTLRLANQLYSVAIVLLILRCRNALSPSFVDVRANTFGLYLTHTFFLLGVRQHQMRLYAHGTLWHQSAASLMLWVASFACTYAMALFLTRWLAKERPLAWTVGVDRALVAPVVRPVAVIPARHTGVA